MTVVLRTSQNRSSFFHWHWGPTPGPTRLPRVGARPQRELTLTPPLGFAHPRVGVAAGAPLLPLLPLLPLRPLSFAP